MNKKKNKIVSRVVVGVVLVSFAFVLISTPVFADSDYREKLDDFADKANLKSETQPIDLVINIINYALGFLGLVFLVITLVAGFKYMTAGGKTENTKEALQSIQNGAIGVGIILLAGIFVNFVLANMVKLFK